MQTFEFSTAGRILFGAGTADRIATEAAPMGRRALLVTGSSPGRTKKLQAALAANGVLFRVVSNHP